MDAARRRSVKAAASRLKPVLTKGRSHEKLVPRLKRVLSISKERDNENRESKKM